MKQTNATKGTIASSKKLINVLRNTKNHPIMGQIQEFSKGGAVK